MAKKIVNVVYKVDSKELDAVKKSLQANQQEAKKFDDNLKKVDKTAKDAGSNASKSFMDFKNILGTISFVGILSGLTSLGKKIFDLGVQQEQLNIAFTTFLGSAEKAKKLMAELTKFSIITPFTPDQVNKAAKTLLAFGTQAKDIIPTLKMLGDVSSGTGKDLSEMAVIFGQIQSTGRLMGQDLLQLINAGFNPLQVISQKTGQSVASLKDEMEKGRISFKMVKDAFRSATTEGGLFFNLMEKQSATVGGKISTLQGNFDEFFKAIFAANKGPVKEFVDTLLELSENLLLIAKTEEQIRDERKQQIVESFQVSKMTYEQELEYLFKTLQLEEARLRGATASWDGRKKISEEDKEATKKKIEDLKLQIETIKELAKAEKDAVDSKPREKKKKLDLTSQDPDIDKQFWSTFIPPPDEQNKMMDELDKFTKGIFDKLDKDLKAENDVQNQAYADDYANFEANEKRKRDLKQQSFQFAMGLLGTLLMAQMSNNSEEQRLLDEKYSKELEAAGNNEAAKKNIETKRKQEQDALRKKQEQDDRTRRINTILAESLVNAVKALGLPPIPGANFIAAAQAVAYGAVQAAIVGKFKDGGWIDGPGTATSDSVPILASKGEFMVNAAAASSSRNLLEAINERKINDNILRAVASTGGRQVNMMDDSRIVKAIEENRVDYINQGYTLMKVEKAGSNFKRYIRAKVQGYK